MSETLIAQLARLRGVGDAYYDYRGELQYFSIQTKAALLRAMGARLEDVEWLDTEIKRLSFARSRALAPPIAIARGPELVLELNVAAREFGATLSWRLNCEDGTQHESTISTTDMQEVWRGEIDGSWITRRRFEIPMGLPAGYHQLELKIAAAPAQRTSLIIGHQKCFEPRELVDGERLWGVAVQLYSVRSRRNWGIGDFDDLHALLRWLAPRGAAFVGLNPLHALAPADPARASPYSASSRHFLNILYIAIESVPDFARCAAAQELLSDFEFRSQLQAMRSRDSVDYPGVARAKLKMLRLLYDWFAANELANDTARAREFKNFVGAGGESLRRHAEFDALDAALSSAPHRHWPGWQNWPVEFRSPSGRLPKEFAADRQRDVEFYLYAQWLAHEQLAGVQTLARELGMPIGLYGDLAVGAHPSGSEVWCDQDLYRLGAEIGAPPDPLALKGQGWGLPPQDPVALEAQALQPFTRLLRNNMRYYGALRLDHVMALFRQWWVASGASPADGAYVHYPLHAMLVALTLESHRRACLIVGEDLGVVPDEIRSAMPDYGLLHYKVLLFEQLAGRFKTPSEYESQALATATTHDMPSLRSYWEAHDIELRERLNLYPDAQVREQLLAARALDRIALLAALEAADLTPCETRAPEDPFSASLADAVHVYLARSRSKLAAIQIEDLLGMREPVNVPGTHSQYPNWQRKLDRDLEDIIEEQSLDRVLAAIDAARKAPLS